MHQNTYDRKRKNLSFLPFFCFFCFSLLMPPTHILSVHVCALVAHPDLDTDFCSNTSLFDLNLAERCTTLPLPADTVWPRLGFYWLAVFTVCLSLLVFYSFYFSLYFHFLSPGSFLRYFCFLSSRLFRFIFLNVFVLSSSIMTH